MIFVGHFRKLFLLQDTRGSREKCSIRRGSCCDDSLTSSLRIGLVSMRLPI